MFCKLSNIFTSNITNQTVVNLSFYMSLCTYIGVFVCLAVIIIISLSFHLVKEEEERRKKGTFRKLNLWVLMYLREV